jgi:hypothetical protein
LDVRDRPTSLGTGLSTGEVRRAKLVGDPLVAPPGCRGSAVARCPGRHFRDPAGGVAAGGPGLSGTEVGFWGLGYPSTWVRYEWGESAAGWAINPVSVSGLAVGVAVAGASWLLVRQSYGARSGGRAGSVSCPPDTSENPAR